MKRLGTSYLRFLTDDFGIWQHSDGVEIDRSQGYALDDSARALLAALELNLPELANSYIGLIERACTAERLVNFFTAEREIWDRPWSPDAVGEAYWALALAIKKEYQKERAENIIATAILPHVSTLLENIRSSAYLLIGASWIDHSLAIKIQNTFVELYTERATSDWLWLEDSLTYGNAIIPYSLLVSGKELSNPTAIVIALQMLDFVNGACFRQQTVCLIGNEGWYPKGGKPALYGQQPIEAAYHIIANIEAYSVTGEEKWLEAAKRFFAWFWGDNIAKRPLIDEERERCLDGINEGWISENAGAENIVCYLYAQELLWPYLN